MSRPPFPPFTAQTAAQKARMAEDAWNTRDPGRVALAYTVDSRWRNRSEFLQGRDAIEAFLKRKWLHELDYRLIKEVWAFQGNRIAVRFAYEWHGGRKPGVASRDHRIAITLGQRAPGDNLGKSATAATAPTDTGIVETDLSTGRRGGHGAGSNSR